MNTAKSQSYDMSLEDQALQMLEGNGTTNLQDLCDVLKARISSLTQSEVMRTVCRLAGRWI
ncbi:MAG: hypothetical protein ABSF00_13675 [Candidatus Bathyarchaeia archaeon]